MASFTLVLWYPLRMRAGKKEMDALSDRSILLTNQKEGEEHPRYGSITGPQSSSVSTFIHSQLQIIHFSDITANNIDHTQWACCPQWCRECFPVGACQLFRRQWWVFVVSGSHRVFSSVLFSSRTHRRILWTGGNISSMFLEASFNDTRILLEH